MPSTAQLLDEWEDEAAPITRGGGGKGSSKKGTQKKVANAHPDEESSDVAPTAVGSSSSSSLLPAHEAIRKLQHHPDVDVALVEVGYEDRFVGVLYMGLDRFRPVTAPTVDGFAPVAPQGDTSTIPFHRIRRIRYCSEVIWDRDERVDRLQEVAQIRASSGGDVALDHRLRNMKALLAAKAFQPLDTTRKCHTSAQYRHGDAIVAGIELSDSSPQRSSSAQAIVDLATFTHHDSSVVAAVCAEVLGIAASHAALCSRPFEVTLSSAATSSGVEVAVRSSNDCLVELAAWLAAAQSQDVLSPIVADRHLTSSLTATCSTITLWRVNSPDGLLPVSRIKLLMLDLQGRLRLCRGLAMPCVLELDSLGRRIRPYEPADALEKWLCRVSDVTKASGGQATHISQLGGAYHVPVRHDAALMDEYLTQWERSVRQADDVQFFVEEMRGDRFRFYLDVDLLLGTEEAPSETAVEAMLLHIVAAVQRESSLTAGSGANNEPSDVSVISCFGPWSDASPEQLPVKSKLGIRLYWQSVACTTDVYEALLPRIAAALSARGAELASSLIVRDRAEPNPWVEVLDAKHASWDRGRLFGTVKRRRVRDLGRRYEYLGVVTGGVQLTRPDGALVLRDLLRRTTLLVDDSVPLLALTN
jgi:uncharacterized protein (UPF0248 family)